MILVDTSVLIDYLKERDNPQTDIFASILEMNIPFGITSLIYQEVLQGASTSKDFNTLQVYLDSFTIYTPQDPKKSYAQAANLYFLCRKAGLTIRSTVDCLIAQIALEHKLKLLHNDKDFYYIKEIAAKLEFY